MDIRTVGVIGAGMIGSGVAHALARTGHRVLLVDRDQKTLESAFSGIRRNARLFGLIDKNQTDAPIDVLQQIQGVTELAELASADFVIENVTENWRIKCEVYHELDRLCPGDLPLAANTSAIPITRISSATQHPSRVVGMHFMNPVPLMPMVELIRGVRTSPHILDVAKNLVGQMGKECIVVNDSPGFVTNRVMMLTVNEAAFLLHEGVASAEEIDRLFKTCFGHKMGPLETADLIGLDTVLYSIEVLYDEFNDGKYRPCPLLKKLVNARQLGRKSGEGFFNYPTESRGAQNQEEIR